MLLSSKEKLIFIHIPKTAGTSIKLALKPYETKKPSDFTQDQRLLQFINERPDRLKEQGMVFPNHMGIWDINKRMTLDLNQYTTFTIIRNPWARFLSLYKHYQRDPMHPYYKQANEYDLNGFAKFLINKQSSSPHVDSLPQINYLIDNSGQVKMNYLLKFEMLEQALDVLCKELGLKPIKLSKINASPQSHDYLKEYNTETWNLISEFEKGIIELGKYSNSPKEQQSTHSVIKILNSEEK